MDPHQEQQDDGNENQENISEESSYDLDHKGDDFKKMGSGYHYPNQEYISNFVFEFSSDGQKSTLRPNVDAVNQATNSDYDYPKTNGHYDVPTKNTEFHQIDV